MSSAKDRSVKRGSPFPAFPGGNGVWYAVSVGMQLSPVTQTKKEGPIWLPPKKTPRACPTSKTTCGCPAAGSAPTRAGLPSPPSPTCCWLSVFATTAVTVIQKGQDLIKVTALPFAKDPAAQVEDQPDQKDWEGVPSLKDLPGVLSMAMLPHKRVKKWSSGPPPLAGRVAAIKPTAMPILSNSFSPVIIQVGRTSDDLTGLTTQITNLGSIKGVVGGDLGDEVGGLRRVGIDVALVVDTTDSMQFVIDSVRERLSNMIDFLQGMVDTTRVGIVAYRDRGEDYVTRWVDFSFNKTHKLNQFLANLEAGGGATGPRPCMMA